MRALVTGATGLVGGRLADALAGDGVEVRALVRDPSRSDRLRAGGHEIRRGDVLERDSLAGAFDEIDVAYYLVHSMGRGGGDDFAQRDRQAAGNFACESARAGVGRVVYLGGLGDPSDSEHLRSRHETAEILGDQGPPLTYFRAAMVVAAGSESYRTLRYLAARLPAMIAPAWLRTETQPIGGEDVIAYLAAAPRVAESAGREVQIGGPDVLSYADMLGEMAEALGKRRPPMIPVPLLTPTLSSLWIGLVTPVDTGVARPLIEGLRIRTVVTDPSGSQPFDVDPTPFRRALADALAGEQKDD